MSGAPIWAITEPSTYSTIEWMMLCGCTTMSIFSGGIENSHIASINSSPLFIRVEESMVILAPMLQFGCLSACSFLTPRSSSRVLP